MKSQTRAPQAISSLESVDSSTAESDAQSLTGNAAVSELLGLSSPVAVIYGYYPTNYRAVANVGIDADAMLDAVGSPEKDMKDGRKLAVDEKLSIACAYLAANGHNGKDGAMALGWLFWDNSAVVDSFSSGAGGATLNLTGDRGRKSVGSVAAPPPGLLDTNARQAEVDNLRDNDRGGDNAFVPGSFLVPRRAGLFSTWQAGAQDESFDQFAGNVANTYMSETITAVQASLPAKGSAAPAAILQQVIALVQGANGPLYKLSTAATGELFIEDEAVILRIMRDTYGVSANVDTDNPANSTVN